MKQRCKRCLLPNNYPEISFNKEGICNYCLNFRKKSPIGQEALYSKLQSTKGDKYDCVVGISGGKDSCYVAYLAKEKFKLRTLAIFYDSPFYCKLARENVKAVCTALNLDLKIITTKDNLEYRLIKNHMISVAATGTSWGQCLFCHYGIDAVLYSIAKEMEIPFKLSGITQYESWYLEKRTQLLLRRLKKLQITDLIRFFVYQSKAYLLLVKQRKQFRMPCNSLFNVYKAPITPSNGPVNVNIFEYVQWNQNEIEKTLIEKTGWVKPKNSISWGYDCILEPFLDYTYKREFGISTIGIYLSNLIRDGLIKRVDAYNILTRSENEELLRKKLDSVFQFLEIPRSIRDKLFYYKKG